MAAATAPIKVDVATDEFDGVGGLPFLISAPRLIWSTLLPSEVANTILVLDD